MKLRVWPRGLLAALALYFALGGLHAFLTPLFEKPDEEWHAAYIAHLAQTGQLPPLVIDPARNLAYQIAGHPPLYYALSALVLRIFDSAPSLPILQPNPFWAYPAPGDVPDNKNRFLHPPNEIFQPGFGLWYGLRLFTLVTGAGAVLAAWAIARQLSASTWVAAASAVFVALLPQYTFIASGLSNDGLVAALAGGALVSLLAALEPQAKRRWWLAFGVLAGLAALTKTNALLVPVFGALCGLGLNAKRRQWQLAVISVSASLGLWLLICGGWYGRNWMEAGDPLGLSVHVEQYALGSSGVQWHLLDQWHRTSVTFWAAFGWTNVQLPAWAYIVFRLFELLGLVGLGLFGFQWWQNRQIPPAWAIVLLLIAVIGGAYLWWTTTVTGTLGRLLFPALAPLAVVSTSGWAKLWPKLPVMILSALGALAALSYVAVWQAYTPPPRQLAAPNTPFIASIGDVAQLQSAHLQPVRLQAGQALTVELCWQTFRATPQPLMLYVQVLDANDNKIGSRDTFPGLGRWPTIYWQTGETFCDEISVPINPQAAGPAVYQVIAGLTEAQTGETLPVLSPNGERIERLTLGEVKVIGSSTPPPAPLAPPANFAEQISLIDFALAPNFVNGRARVELYWRAEAAPLPDYTVFLHLVDAAGTLITQNDSLPQAGLYATHWWDLAEVVYEERWLEMPASTPAGEYRVFVGWYLPETGERLPLAATGADALELGAIRYTP